MKLVVALLIALCGGGCSAQKIEDVSSLVRSGERAVGMLRGEDVADLDTIVLSRASPGGSDADAFRTPAAAEGLLGSVWRSDGMETWLLDGTLDTSGLSRDTTIDGTVFYREFVRAGGSASVEFLLGVFDVDVGLSSETYIEIVGVSSSFSAMPYEDLVQREIDAYSGDGLNGVPHGHVRDVALETWTLSVYESSAARTTAGTAGVEIDGQLYEESGVTESTPRLILVLHPW